MFFFLLIIASVWVLHKKTGKHPVRLLPVVILGWSVLFGVFVMFVLASAAASHLTARQDPPPPPEMAEHPDSHPGCGVAV